MSVRSVESAIGDLIELFDMTAQKEPVGNEVVRNHIRSAIQELTGINEFLKDAPILEMIQNSLQR